MATSLLLEENMCHLSQQDFNIRISNSSNNRFEWFLEDYSNPARFGRGEVSAVPASGRAADICGGDAFTGFAGAGLVVRAMFERGLALQ